MAKTGISNGKGRPAPRRKRRTFWSFVKTFFQVTTVFVLVSIITFMVWAYVTISNTPSAITLDPALDGITYIYSADGTELAEFFTERRKSVPIDEIPKALQDATVAFEDKRFYQHQGVDFHGIARALSSNIHHGDMKGEGGSTITQQLARNSGVEGLDRRKSFGRKIKELIVANQIEKNYTKQDILTMYLNLVNYGSSAYGVEAAAEVYFGKHARQLDLAQCALLAGLPNRPTEFSPYKDMDAAKAQRKRVLDQMLEQGKITVAQYTQAVKEPIKLAGSKTPSQGSQIFHAPYFVNYIVDQLGRDRVYNGNLKVYTTLNWPMQKIAERELENGIADAQGYGPTQGALVALDPKTGEIKAMVGGVDFKKVQTNYATHGRQPGSSFKAVVYSAAINDGSVSEKTRVYDAPVSFPSGNGGTWTPQDDTGYSYNHVDLRTAMAYSINIPAIRVLHLIGPSVAIRYARMMGVKPSTALDPVLSLALGSSPVSPLEMASVYSTFPDGGNHAQTAAWTRLTDGRDTVIEDDPPAIETHVLQKDTVTQLDDMLRAVVDEPGGTGHIVEQYVPDARGKTGTTQEHKDVWFVGYTSDLVCAVWAGHPIYRAKNKQPAYGQEMAHNAFGATICAPIFGKFMSQALPLFQAARAREEARAKAKQPLIVKTTPAPLSFDSNSDTSATPPAPRRPHRSPPRDNGDGTVTVTVDDSTGQLAPDGSPGSHPETFTAGTEPIALAPQYTVSPNNSDTTSDTRGANVLPAGSNQHPHSRHHRRRHDNGDGAVTVMINPEDGLLATKYCPQQVPQTFTQGQEPHEYSSMYPPPPGEQP